MHLGPLCPISIHGSPVALLKFQMAPQTYILNILWLQEERVLMHMAELTQVLTPTQHMWQVCIGTCSSNTTYVVGLKSLVNGTRKQTKRKIQTN
jgi:hypothetical protein